MVLSKPYATLIKNLFLKLVFLNGAFDLMRDQIQLHS